MFAVPVTLTLLPGVTEKYSTVPAGRSIPVGDILLDLLFVSCTNEIRHPSDVATLIRFDNAVYSLSVTSSDADILAATIPFNASSFEAFLVEKYPPICCLSMFFHILSSKIVSHFRQTRSVLHNPGQVCLKYLF